MGKEYLRCPNCEDGKGRIYLMEVAGVERGFYICSNCDRVWKRYWALETHLVSEWRWHDYLKEMGVSPSNIKVTKKPLVVMEEENPGDKPSLKKDYLHCPVCEHGVIHRMSIKGLKEEIDACEECDQAWEKGTAIQRDSFSLGDYIKKKGISLKKVEITKENPLVLIEEDQV